MVDLPVPPNRMPPLRGGRPLKRWRYVGVFGPELSLCVGLVRVGIGVQSFWAVWDRTTPALAERTALGTGGVRLGRPGGPATRARVRRTGVEIDLRIGEDAPAVEVTSPHGGQYIWTRKVPVRVTGTVTVAGRTLPVDARGLVDDSAGYHTRHTEWRWCAGVGRTEDDRAVTWNLVSGVHDVEPRTERAVWLDGTPAPAGVTSIADELDRVTTTDGGDLRFTGEAVRQRRDRVLGGLVRSDYVQPFGTFTGVLPGGLTLAEGYGVLERHSAHW